MDREEFVMRENLAKPFVQRVLFKQWVGNLIDVNVVLNRQYNTIYQRSYYVLVAELLTTGREYIKKISERNDCEVYHKLNDCIQRMCNVLSADETLFLTYKRDSASHIFQNRYDITDSDGNLKAMTKSKKDGYNIVEINQIKDRIISKYVTDRAFSDYILKSFNPIISELDKLLF